MSEDNNQIASPIFTGVAWILAVYFFVCFHLIAGFPPTGEVTKSAWAYLALSLFAFLVPFAKRVKLGKLLEFEREIKAVRSDLSDFKNETRQTMTLLSSTLNTVGNVSSTVNVHVPSPAERAAAQAAVLEVATAGTAAEAMAIKHELTLDDEDTIIPLLRVRIRIEQLLRQILGKRLVSAGVGESDLRFLSARALFALFAKEYPRYAGLEQSVRYVLTVCNAAIHGQRIGGDEAAEALDTGSKIIAVLSDVAGEKPATIPDGGQQ